MSQCSLVGIAKGKDLVWGKSAITDKITAYPPDFTEFLLFVAIKDVKVNIRADECLLFVEYFRVRMQ